MLRPNSLACDTTSMGLLLLVIGKITFGLGKANAQFFAFSFIELMQRVLCNG